MKKVVWQQVDLVKAGELLKKHCALVDGKAVYAKGWSDESLAASVDPRYTAAHVAGLRKKLIGHMSGERNAPPVDDRIELIERNVAGHDADIVDLIEKHNALAAAYLALIGRLGEGQNMDEILVIGRNKR